MKGYLKVAAIMPTLKVGNVKFNTDNIKEEILKANSLGVKVCVFPELCLTGVNLQSLYLDKNILNGTLDSIFSIVNFSNELDTLIIVSGPFEYFNNVFEVAIIIKSGKILGFVPKKFFDKKELNFKYFNSFESINYNIDLTDTERNINYQFPFSNNIVFENKLFTLSIIFNENFNNIINTSIYADITAIPETLYIDNKIKSIKNLSNDFGSAIIVSSSGSSESSSNFVFFGRSLIAENGDIICKNDILSNHILIADIDLDKITIKSKIITEENSNITYVKFDYLNFISNSLSEKLFRDFDKTPYINKNVNPYNYSMHIINILAIALSKRFTAINSSEFVIGVSGGLDSTFALLVIKKAIEFLSLNNSNIHAFSMPCFGTTVNSNKNIIDLLNSLNIDLNEINISNAISLHFNDIKHDINNTNVTFENAQARERMQILMDIANDINGLVVGTSDLSESALGFSTYNGDHMSMYNVNGSIPKTLIRYILNAIAEENIKNNNNINLANALKNILHTPISPELLPTENGILIQKTEEILGNYEIHDFILYNYLKYNFDMKKLFDLSLRTFVYNNKENKYTEEYIKNCINVFFNKFFKAQYKRSTAPDSPSIGLPSLNINFNIPNDTEIKIEI